MILRSGDSKNLHRKLGRYAKVKHIENRVSFKHVIVCPGDEDQLRKTRK